MTGDVLDTPQAGGLVVRGGALRLVSYILSTALGVVAAALVIRHLGAADYGRYVAIFSLVTLVGSVTDAGMTTLGIREYATRQDADRRALMQTLLGLRLALTAAGLMVALAFVAVADYDSALLAGAALAGGGLVLTVAQVTLTVPLSSELLIGRVSALELARQALTTLVLLGLVVLDAGVVALLAAPLPVGAVLLVVTAVLVRGRVPLRASFDWGAWLRLLRLTAAFAVATAVGTIYVYLAVVLMPLVTTNVQTGYFGTAFRAFIVLVAVPGLLVSTAFPLLARAARDDRERLRYAMQRLYEVTLAAGVLVALVTALGAPIAIDVLAGSGFEDATEALRVQSLAIIASFLLATWGFGLISLHRHRALLVANGLALVVSAALVLTLAAEYGAVGAAVATVVGETVLAVAYLAALVRADRRLLPQIAVVWKVGLAGLAGGLAGALPAWDALPATLAGAAVFAAVAVPLGVIPPELTERLPWRRR